MDATLNLNLHRVPLMTVYGKKHKLFSEFIIEHVEKCRKSEAYKSMYRNISRHITDYSKYSGRPIYTETMSEEVLEEFVFFLQDKRKLMISTVKGLVERTKTMLQKACNCGYDVDGSFRDFVVRDEEIDTVFFSMTDIARIYYFSDLTTKQKEIRDYFIIGCLTGLRYSDYSRLNTDNFLDKKIVIRTKKTKTPVQIPMHPFVRDILKKYNGVLPPSRCIQYFNKSIKIICKKIGFTEMHFYERHIGLEYVSTMLPIYLFISSHTARRSFATNMFLANVQTYRIMLITGHKSESAFFRYIRITKEENAMTLSGHQFFN